MLCFDCFDHFQAVRFVVKFRYLSVKFPHQDLNDAIESSNEMSTDRVSFQYLIRRDFNEH